VPNGSNSYPVTAASWASSERFLVQDASKCVPPVHGTKFCGTSFSRGGSWYAAGADAYEKSSSSYWAHLRRPPVQRYGVPRQDSRVEVTKQVCRRTELHLCRSRGRTTGDR